MGEYMGTTNSFTPIKHTIMSLTIAVICAVVAAVSCNPPPSYSPPSYDPAPAYKPAPSYHKEPSYDEPAAYKFDYGVKSEDGHYGYVDFGQNEVRDGYNTQGSYYV